MSLMTMLARIIFRTTNVTVEMRDDVQTRLTAYLAGGKDTEMAQAINGLDFTPRTV